MSNTRKNDAAAAAAPKLHVQRIRVNAQGYDRGGCYWGAGPDVFIVSAADGSEEVTVRAKDAKEARQRAADELAGKAPDGKRKAIGGNAPRKSCFEMNWRNAITGQTVRIRVSHARDYLVQGTDHVEIESIAPPRAPLPITETGYRSHFLSPDDIARGGGVKMLVGNWLESAAALKPWQRSQAAAAQGDLFQWAKAKAEVGNRKAKKPARPAAKAAKQKKPRRSPAPK